MTRSRRAAVLCIATVAVFASLGSSSESATKSDTGSGGDSKSSSQETTAVGVNDEVDDLELLSCAPNPDLKWGEAKVKVTNNSSKASSYIIEVKIDSADGATSFGTATGFVNNLGAGQMKEETLTSTEDMPADAKCTVSKVDRTADV